MMMDAPTRSSPPTALRLRPLRTVVGLVCAVAVPSLLMSSLFAAESGGSAMDALGGAAVFAFFGTMSILSLFLPLILWRLPRARHPLATCIGTGAISGPGWLGYVTLLQKLSLELPLLAVASGAVGGGVFWLVAVRPRSASETIA